MRPKRADVAVLAALMLIAGLGTAAMAQSLRPEIGDELSFDYWFEADAPRFSLMMSTRRDDEHKRTVRHALFSLASGLPISVAHKLTGIERGALVSAWLGAVAALWAGASFVLLRGLGLATAAALAFALLWLSSASALFILPLPSPTSIGSLSIVSCGIVVCAAERREVPAWVYVAVAALSLSFTSTNWMAGGLMLLVTVGVVRAVGLGALSLGVVLVLWVVQRVLVPHAGFFLAPGDAGDFLFHPRGGGWLETLSVGLSHAVALPRPVEAFGTYQSVQSVVPGSGDALNVAAAGAWILMLGLGLSAVRHSGARPVGRWAVLLLVAQLVLHRITGEEDFQHALHWLPALGVLAALGATGGGWRRYVPIGALVAALLLGAANARELRAVREMLVQRVAEAHGFREAVAAHTDLDDLLIWGIPHSAARDARTPAPHPAERDAHALWLISRRGWLMNQEYWSEETIEGLHRRGATHFGSHHALGLQEHAAALARLKARYTVVVEEPGYLILEFTPAASGPGASPR